MVRESEELLICDFAETYHIYNWRSLPLNLAATLACGLRDDSRIKLKLNKQRVSNTELLLAVIVDRLGILLAGLSGEEIPESFVENVFEEKLTAEKDDNTIKFDSIEAFELARKQILNGGS